MNKLIKLFKYRYLVAYLVAFIIVILVLLMLLNNSGIDCLYNCESDKKPTYGKVNNYINGKRV